MTEIKTRNSAETRKFGLKLAKKTKAGDVFALCGNLGAGKTTLIQGLAKGLSVKNKITSPTFVQLKIYPLKKRGVDYLYHFDFYRQESVPALQSRGLKEYLNNKRGVVVIEWADKIKKFLPQKAKIIKLSHAGGNNRLIKINKK